MAGASNGLPSPSERIQDYDYLLASNTNVSNFVSVKLSGTHNYPLWKGQVIRLLDSIGMRSIVDDTVVDPRNYDSETMRKYDNLVTGWIFGSLDEDILKIVNDLKSTKAVWEKLKSMYARSLPSQEQEVVGSADTIEIITDQDQSRPVNEDELQRVDKIEHKKKLHEAILKGDWLEAEPILKKDKGLATEAISPDGSTFLHIAVAIDHNHLVEKIFSYINDDQVLLKRDSDGSTPLHIAANVANQIGAELLVEKNKGLLQIQDNEGKEPVHKAYRNMHLDTITYLLKAAIDDAENKLLAGSLQPNDEIAVPLLLNAVAAKKYCLASILVENFPTFASKGDDVLTAIAKNFPREESFTLFTSNKKRREQNEAKFFLKLVCDEIDKSQYSGTHHPYYTQPILEAARQNSDEVMHEILLRSPEAMNSRDENGYDIIQLAIIHRSDKIIMLINDIGERKNIYRTVVDSLENTILHLAAKLPPSSVLNQRTSYEALQLQGDLQLMEVLKKFVYPTCVSKKNVFGQTPNMIFTREHENIKKEATRWMRNIAKACIIIAALIFTLVFTPLNTIQAGSPLLVKKQGFAVFIITSTFSLFVSAISLLVFLSILVSHFEEKDFLLRLPRRLLIGLFCLFLSTIGMWVSFSTILFLAYCDGKPWMLAPICGLASVTVASFVALQLPLMVDIFRSTYFGMFGRKKKQIRRKYFC